MCGKRFILIPLVQALVDVQLDRLLVLLGKLEGRMQARSTPPFFSIPQMNLLALSVVLMSLMRPLTGDSIRVVTGVVADSVEGIPVPLAILRVVGSNHGAVTAEDGRFTMDVPFATVDIRCSHVGYIAKKIHLPAGRDTNLRVLLQPLVIRVSEVVVLGEDPGMALMRSIIDGIAVFKAAQRNYRFRTLAKSLTRSDAIRHIGVSSGVTSGHIAFGRRYARTWSKGWWTRDTSFTAFDRLPVLDLTEERIRIWGAQCVGVLSPAALEAYRFSLDSTVRSDGGLRHYLSVRSRMALEPGLEGQIIVDGESDRVLSVHLRSNGILRGRPPLQIEQLDILHLFEESGGRWLPSAIRQQVRLGSASSWGVPVVRFDELVSVDKVEYGLDSLDAASSWTAQTATSIARPSVDTTELRLVPLTEAERQIIIALDTTGRVFDGVPPNRATNDPGDLMKIIHSVLPLTNLIFTRPTGVGAGIEFSILRSPMRIDPSLTYGFADGRVNWNVHAKIPIDTSRKMFLYAHAYQTVQSDVAGDRFRTEGMIADLLFGEPNADYYRSAGWSLGVDQLCRGIRLRLEFSSRMVSVAAPASAFTVFPRSRPTRRGPDIPNQQWQSIEAEMALHPWDISLRISNGEPWKPAGRYSRIVIAGMDTTESLWRGNPAAPFFVWRVVLAGSRGTVPAHDQVSPETRIWHYAGPMVFRGMQPKEFAGDQMVALVAEHHFGVLPLVLFGNGSLPRSNLDIVFHLGTALVFHDDLAPSGCGVGRRPTAGLYAEGGLGVSGILPSLCVEVTRRLSNDPSNVLTVNWSYSLKPTGGP